MTGLQSLSAYPVGAPPAAVEEIAVKAKKPEDERFTFWGFLDVINSLQHVPVVNAIYREITGDEIKPPAKMIGGAIIGGPIGLAVAMTDAIVKDATGKDMGGHARAMFRGEEAGAPVAPTVTETATAAVAALKGSGREFTSTAVSAVLSAALQATSILDDQDDGDNPTRPSLEQPAAATAAAAPRGLVFMPLPGRQQPGAPKLTNGAAPTQKFIPLNPTGRSTVERRPSSQSVDQTAMAQIQAAFPGATRGNEKTLDSTLEAVDKYKAMQNVSASCTSG